MIANQLTNGQFFKLIYRGHPSKYDETDVLECVDENRPADWMRYPGIVYRNTRTGLHGGLGGANEIVLCNAPEPAKTIIKQEWQSMDISSGLGIGGVGSDDFNINSDIIEIENQKSCSWGGTRYDEACARCGRVTEICNDCELCEKCHE